VILGGCASTPPKSNAPLELRVIGINDFHGYLDPNPLALTDPADPLKQPATPEQVTRVPAGGAAHLASTVARLKGESPHALVVGVGDLIGAGPLISALIRDEPTLQAMRAIGMRVSAVGNHEFDYGQAELERLSRGGCARAGCLLDDPYPGAGFPYISANIFNAEGEHAFPPSFVETVDGVRVAFIGATVQETPLITLKERVAGLRFDKEAPAINAESARLKALGIRAQIVLLHEGASLDGPAVNPATCAGLSGPAITISRALDREIDVVMTAHTHRRYVCTLDGKLLTQAESYGRLLASVDLKIDRRSGEVLSKSAVVVRVDPTTDAANPDLAALVERARAKTDVVAREPIARIADPQISDEIERSGESPLGRVMADAQLAATRDPANGGAQIALMNHGGVRQKLPLETNQQNLVTRGDCYAAHPFNNAIVVMDLTGAELKTLLEEQWDRNDKDRFLSGSAGLTYRWDNRRVARDKIIPRSLMLNGAPIEPARTYRVATNQFLADGGGGFSMFVKGRNRITGGVDVDMLIAYLKANEPLATPREPRAVRVD
jgi:5'-nucleotidase